MSVINWNILYINDPLKGRPLFGGKIYVGEPDLDPEIVGNQKQLNVIQEDGAVVAVPQPFILSAGGVPMYNGSPVRLDVDGNFSIKILDKNDSQTYYIENIFDGQPVTVQEMDAAIDQSFIDNRLLFSMFDSWSVSTGYSTGSVVIGSNGETYRSLLSQTGNDPVTDTGTNWTLHATTPNTTDLLFSSIDNMIAGTSLGGQPINLLPGQSVTTLGELCSVFTISSGGTADDIEVFLLNNGNYAQRVSSIAGDQYYSHKQRGLFFEQMKYLREDGVFQFNWYGDSNSVRDNNQAQLSFIAALDSAYGTGKTQIKSNRGQSGASAEEAFNIFTTPSAVNISVFNFGTNDASSQFGYPLVKNCEQYEYWLERLLIRELNWGNPCVLITPLPVRFDKANETYTYQVPTDQFPLEKRVDVYQMAGVMQRLGDKYSIPVIDSNEAVAPFRDIAYSGVGAGTIANGVPFADVVHLDSAYLAAWGDSIARMFIGNLAGMKTEVSAGSRVTVRKFYDPIAVNSARDYEDIIDYAIASTETNMAYGDFNGGNRSMALTVAGEKVTWSVYCIIDDILAFPMIQLGVNSEVNVVVDNGNQIPFAPLDAEFDYGARLGNDSVTINLTTAGQASVNRTPTNMPLISKLETNSFFRINNRGWHTISVQLVSGTVNVSGVSFEHNAIAERIEGVVDWDDGVSITLAGNNQMFYAPSGAVGIPAGATDGFFINNIARDKQRGTIRFYENSPTHGRTFLLSKTVGAWGPWTQI